MKLLQALLLVLGAASCRTGRSYLQPNAPRYFGGTPARASSASPDTLRVATFNIEFALRIDSAIALLTSDTILSRSDVLLLQEMDAPSTARVADALGMQYVYYPSLLRFKYGRDVGNAVLSRWPIVADAKLILPHPSAFVRTRRTATAATIQVGTAAIRVYSAHLGTVFNVNPQQRAQQLGFILEDASRYDRVVIGADLNDEEVGRVAAGKGYAWPTRDGPRTATVGRLDHILLRGIRATPLGGTVLDNRGSSDHRPVWAIGVLGS